MLVDDDDLAVLHHVVDLVLVEGVGAQRLLHVVEGLDLGGVVEVGDTEELLQLLDPLVGEAHGAGLLVLRVVLLLDEPRDERIDLLVEGGGLLGRPADDEWGPRLVDEDGVDLVHDGEVQLSLHVVLQPELHVVSKVVETELVVLAVGDVRAVGRLPLRIGQAVDDDAVLETQEAVDLPHPLGVAAGQIVVDGDDVDATPLEGVEHAGEGRREGLPLTGSHLGDAPLMKDGAADDLHVEVAHPQDPDRRLAGERKGLGEEVVERSPLLLDLLLPFGHLPGEVGVGELLHLGLVPRHGVDQRPELLQLPLVLGADDFIGDPLDHGDSAKEGCLPQEGYNVKHGPAV